MNEITFKKIFLKAAEEKQMVEFKNVVLTENNIKMTTSKSFTTGAVANRQGLIGILLNKFFSSMMKTNTYEFSFDKVKKVEISTSTMRGMTTHNIMFWNASPADANYENIDFTMSPSPKRLEEVKTVLSRLFRKVDFKELEPQSF